MKESGCCANRPAARAIARHPPVRRAGGELAARRAREFELPGEDAIMRKDGDRLIIEPSRPKSLLALLATLSPIDEDFPPIEDRPPELFDL